MERTLALFWSYAHADDEADRGRILALAEHVRAEFALATGTDVDLFVDKEGIRWGEDWRQRIDEALDSSSFFVPVLTARYFVRSECRRELTDFYGQAESRGLHKLIMPILYSNVPGLDTESKDELLALAARTQYVNWTALRLADTHSERYRTAVNAVVVELLDRWREMREVEGEISSAAAELDVPGEWGLAEAVSEIDARLRSWLELVEDDPVLRAQHIAVDKTYTDRMDRARPQQRLSIEHRLVVDLLPLASRDLEIARSYSALTIEMHPFVLAALRAARSSSEARCALEPLANAVAEAKREIDAAANSESMLSRDYWQSRAHLGAKFRQLAEIANETDRFKHEGNVLLAEWIEQLTELEMLSEGRGGNAPFGSNSRHYSL